MIGNALRMDIEIYAGQSDRNALFATARAGQVSREMIMQYVGGLHFLMTKTPLVCTTARDRARALGDEALASHFQHKLEEETGHAKWAERDLKRLDTKRSDESGVSLQQPQRPRFEPISSVNALASYVLGLAETQPSLVLAYVAFAEYITVIKGPELLDLLDTHCGIPKTSMTAVGNHVTIDRDHAEEAFSLMDDLVGDPRMLPEMRQALARAIELFEAFCTEVTSIAPSHATHVSAA